MPIRRSPFRRHPSAPECLLRFPGAWEFDRHFHQAIASVLIPFPGTELYETFKDEFGFTNWWVSDEEKYRFFDVKSKSFFESEIGLQKKDSHWSYAVIILQVVKKYHGHTLKILLKDY